MLKGRQGTTMYTFTPHVMLILAFVVKSTNYECHLFPLVTRTLLFDLYSTECEQQKGVLLQDRLSKQLL